MRRRHAGDDDVSHLLLEPFMRNTFGWLNLYIGRIMVLGTRVNFVHLLMVIPRVEEFRCIRHKAEYKIYIGPNNSPNDM